jgi:actin, other eukaryote
VKVNSSKKEREKKKNSLEMSEQAKKELRDAQRRFNAHVAQLEIKMAKREKSLSKRERRLARGLDELQEAKRNFNAHLAKLEVDIKARQKALGKREKRVARKQKQLAELKAASARHFLSKTGMPRSASDVAVNRRHSSHRGSNSAIRSSPLSSSSSSPSSNFRKDEFRDSDDPSWSSDDSSNGNDVIQFDRVNDALVVDELSSSPSSSESDSESDSEFSSFASSSSIVECAPRRALMTSVCRDQVFTREFDCSLRALAERRPTLVVDCGSHSLRAGLASDERPSLDVRSTMHAFGHSTVDEDELLMSLVTLGNQDRWFSALQAARRTCAKPMYAMLDGGGQVPLGNFAASIEFAYASVAAHSAIDSPLPLALTVSTFSSRAERAERVEHLLETLNVDELLLLPDAVASLYSVGLRSGVSIECGAHSTRVVPVLWGSALRHASVRHPVGGASVTDALHASVARRVKSAARLPTSTFEAVKRKLCYVAPNFDAELADVTEGRLRATDITLAGKTVDIGLDAFQSTEVLFQPTLLGIDAPPLGSHLRRIGSTLRAEYGAFDEQWRDIQRSAVISGGGSLLGGFDKRIGRVCRDSSRANIVVHPPVANRHLNCWTGAAFSARSSTLFDHASITTQRWHEHGDNLIDRIFW